MQQHAVRGSLIGNKGFILPVLCKLTVFLLFSYLNNALAENGLKTGESANELVFLTWTDYIDPAVVSQFEQRYNVVVKQVYFESDDDRDDILAENNAVGYDVILADGISVTAYARQGWLAPLSISDIPNLNYIDDKWRQAFPKTNEYGVPYFWGTIGIAYRRDLVPEPFTSWMQLFRPHESLRGKIVMIKHARDVIGMALKALGYSENSTDPHELDKARELILAQKPFVKTYSYVAITEKSALVTGDVYAAMVFNGDGIMLKGHHPDIDFVVPEEGSNLGVDYLTVANASKNKKLATTFINFLNQPKNAARIAKFVHYATPNVAAHKYLPASYFQDSIIYPNADTLSKCEFWTELTPRATQQRNLIFQSVIQ